MSEWVRLEIWRSSHSGGCRTVWFCLYRNLACFIHFRNLKRWQLWSHQKKKTAQTTMKCSSPPWRPHQLPERKCGTSVSFTCCCQVSAKPQISHWVVTQNQKNALTEISVMKRPLCECVSQHRRANSSRQDLAVYLHLKDKTHSLKDNKRWMHRHYSVPKRSIRGHLCKTGTHHAWTKGEELIHLLMLILVDADTYYLPTMAPFSFPHQFTPPGPACHVDLPSVMTSVV